MMKGKVFAPRVVNYCGGAMNPRGGAAEEAAPRRNLTGAKRPLS